MYLNVKLFWQFTFVLLVIISSTSCSLESEETGKSETTKTENILHGKVVYDVKFPYVQNKILERWLPKEYSLEFSDDRIYGEMNSSFNLICNRFYADNKKKVLYQCFDNAGKRFQSKIDENSIVDLQKQYPKMIIGEPIMDTVILGIKCKVAIADFSTDSVPSVKLYYTDEIKVKSSNWYNQYTDLDFFLMGYDIEQFGMRMNLMAKELVTEEPSIEKNRIYDKMTTKDYESMSPEDLQKEFEKLLTTIAP